MSSKTNEKSEKAIIIPQSISEEELVVRQSRLSVKSSDEEELTPHKLKDISNLESTMIRSHHEISNGEINGENKNSKFAIKLRARRQKECSRSLTVNGDEAHDVENHKPTQHVNGINGNHVNGSKGKHKKDVIVIGDSDDESDTLEVKKVGENGVEENGMEENGLEENGVQENGVQENGAREKKDMTTSSSMNSKSKKPKKVGICASNATKKKTRITQNQEIPVQKQTSLTDHFKIRRSERRPKNAVDEEAKIRLKKKILSGVEEGLEIRFLEEKGRGIFSTKTFNKGDFICEYAGELIDAIEARAREIEYEKDPDIGSYMYFFEFKNKKYCVDATKESDRLGRLLNHSKTSSNVCTKLFPIDGMPYLILVASDVIEPDQELLYDYGDRSQRSLDTHPWLKC